MKLRPYRDYKGQWRWRVVAANGKRQSNCGEGYHNLGDCLKNAAAQLLPEIIEAGRKNIEAAQRKAAKSKARKVKS